MSLVLCGSFGLFSSFPFSTCGADGNVTCVVSVCGEDEATRNAALWLRGGKWCSRINVLLAECLVDDLHT